MSEKKICAYEKCGVEFMPIRPWQKFHTTKCRNGHHNMKNNETKPTARTDDSPGNVDKNRDEE